VQNIEIYADETMLLSTFKLGGGELSEGELSEPVFLEHRVMLAV